MSTGPVTLLPRITCPHCWHKFEPHEVLWIATHATLRGDPRLGPEASPRFLPSRYSPRGDARDELGNDCNQLACPKCHLVVPRLCLELAPWFVSIFGAPGCGKSYILSTMIWALRRTLPDRFRISFTDSDAEFNAALVANEQQLFCHPDADKLVPLGQLIDKTQEQGDLYDTVLVDGRPVLMPRPFLFTVRPRADHPAGPNVDPGRVLCLYDNAGESFLAGRDSAVRPVTRHLAESGLLLFLFDPTQDAPFRRRMAASGSPIASDLRSGQALPRQDVILTEAAGRIRRFAGLPENSKHEAPLIVVVSKRDVWSHLIPELNSLKPAVRTSPQGNHFLNLDQLEENSQAIRTLLRDTTPEVVEAAEGFAKSVTYIGVSALGVAPVRLPNTGQWAVRPRELKPDGVEVPILYGLHLASSGLVAGGRRSTRQPNQRTQP